MTGRQSLSAALTALLLLAGATPVAAQTLIQARTPSRGATTGGTSVEILATTNFFNSGTTVTFVGGGAQPRNVTVHTPRRLTFVTPARAAGTYTLRVTTGGTSSDTNFTYVARTRSGIQGARRPVFSHSGHYMAFESRYALVAGDTNGVTDIYVRNRATGTVRRVSVSSTGDQALGGESTRPAISANGRYVAFQSRATNLVPGDSNNVQDIFVHDRDADENGVFDLVGRTDRVSTERVSLGTPGAGPPQQANGDSSRPVLNGNGRFVAFHSAATNLIGGDGNARLDVFVFDRHTRRTRAVSSNDNQQLGNSHSRNAAINLSGRYIAYESLADNLAGGATGFFDVFLKDRDADGNGVFDEPSGTSVTLVSFLNQCEQTLDNAHSVQPSITYDGRYIAFATTADNAIVDGNCAPADLNNVSDVYLYDRLNGTLRRLSEGPNGSGFTGASSAPVISGNGNLLRFTTQAQNASGANVSGAIVGAVDDGKSTTGEVPSPTDPAPPDADVPPPPPDQDTEDPATSGDGTTTGGTQEPDAGTNDGEPEVEVEEAPEDPSPAPFIAGLAPASGPITGSVVLIEGANFVNGQTTVLWNGNFLSSTVLNTTTVRVTAPAVGGDTTVDVRVLVGPTGQSQASNIAQYTYATGKSAPAITSITQNTTGPVTGGTAVFINGSGFEGNPIVRFGGVTATLTLFGSNQLRVTSPSVVSAGPVPIVVENADGGIAVSDTPFTYTFAPIQVAPAIASLNPVRGPVTGGTAITITGQGFTETSTVRVAGVPATDVQVIGNTQIVAVTPAGVEGPANVIVTTTNGDSPPAPAATFAYDPLSAPVLTCSGGGDTDSDGMANDWETQYGLSINDGTDAALDFDGDGLTNLQECTAGTHPRGLYTRYLAEGATGPFFDTRVVLANPGATPARVLFRFQTQLGEVVRHFLMVPATSRRTVDLRLLSGLGAADISTVVESDVQVVVDRTMRWDLTTRAGAHAESSAPAPSLTWYLAEGATHGSFNLFYLIQNPSQTTTANVQVRFLLPMGAPIVRDYQVPANSRFTLPVDDVPGLGATDVSGVITSTNAVPIIVERAMYSSAAGVFAAGHDAAGVTAPALNWFFAEGATGNFFDEFLLLANPNGSDASVAIRYLLPGGAFVDRNYTVAANSRRTLYVAEQAPALANTAVSATVSSTNGVTIIAERSMWWPHGSAWTEAHAAAGATTTGTKWGVADGEVGNLPDDTATFLLIANTAGVAATVRVTLLFETGAAISQDFSVAANARFNVPVLSTEAAPSPGYMRVPRGTRFSAVIESVGGTPIVVERAMYWNAAGQFWGAGSDLLATKLQ